MADGTRKIDTKELLKKPMYFDEETGEIFTHKKYSKKNHSIEEAKSYPSITTIAISNYRSQINQFASEKGGRILEKWLEKMIGDNGEKAVANMLIAGGHNGTTLTFQEIYNAEARAKYMYNMMNELEEQGEIYAEDVSEMMQEMENMEDWEQV